MVASDQSKSGGLSRMCDGAWWMSQSGQWETLDEGGGIAGEQKAEGLAQVMATICLLHLDPGVELVLRVGARLMVCNVYPDGVRVGWRSVGGNPLVISTVLKRAELQSSTSRQMVELPQIPQAQNSSSSLVAETAVSLQESDGTPKTSTPNPDKHFDLSKPKSVESWSRDRVTATVVDLTGGEERRIESIHLGNSDSEGMEFEIVYEDSDDCDETPYSGRSLKSTAGIDPSAVPPEEATREHTPPQPAERMMCWMDFERIVDNLSDLASRELGDKVVGNYWRQALQVEPELVGLVRYDREEGMQFMEVAAGVTSEEAARILGVIERWLARCERVVPKETNRWRQMVSEELDLFWLES